MASRLPQLVFDVRRYVLLPYLLYDPNYPVRQTWLALEQIDPQITQAGLRAWQDQHAEHVYRKYYSSNNYLLDRYYNNIKGQYNYRQVVADIQTVFTLPMTNWRQAPIFRAIGCRLDLLADSLISEFEKLLWFAIKHEQTIGTSLSGTLTTIIYSSAQYDNVAMLEIIIKCSYNESIVSYILAVCRGKWYAHLLAAKDDITSPLYERLQLEDIFTNQYRCATAIRDDNEPLYSELLAKDPSLATMENITDIYFHSAYHILDKDFLYPFDHTFCFDMLSNNMGDDHSHEFLDVCRQKPFTKNTPLTLCNDFAYTDPADLYDFIDLSTLKSFSAFSRTLCDKINILTGVQVSDRLMLAWPKGLSAEDYLNVARDEKWRYEHLDIERVTEPGYRQFLAYVFASDVKLSAYMKVVKYFYLLNCCPDYPITAICLTEERGNIHHIYQFTANVAWRIVVERNSNKLMRKQTIIPPHTTLTLKSTEREIICISVLLPLGAENDFVRLVGE